MGLYRLAAVTCVVATSALVGCAHPKVTDVRGTHTIDGAPPMIFVRNFEIGATVLKKDPGTLTGRPRLVDFRENDPAAELEKLSDMMAEIIVDDLKKANLPAGRISETQRRPADGWIVSGELLEVMEGNRMQNAVIGFGVGSAESKLFVAVHEASKLPGQDVLDFNVDAKGTVTPSGIGTAAVTHVPYAMAAKFVLNRDASKKEAEKAAHEVAAQLVKLAHSHAGK